MAILEACAWCMDHRKLNSYLFIYLFTDILLINLLLHCGDGDDD